MTPILGQVFDFSYMNFFIIFLIICILSTLTYRFAGNRVKNLSLNAKPETLQSYYSWFAVIWGVIPALAAYVIILLTGFIPSLYIKSAVIIIIFLFGSGVSVYLISPKFKARQHLEKIAYFLLISCTVISIVVTISIVFSVLFESIRFFKLVPFTDFLFGTKWSPQTALRADQAGSSGSFGAIPVFTGTLLITFIAMCIAVPVGLFSAIFISEYASTKFRNTIKPALEILAGIPTVVYGYFAVVTFSPALRSISGLIGISTASESAIAAGVIMGIMIIPFILSLSDDVMNAVPRSLRDVSYALGATKSETITKVVIPAALPGIMGAVLLAISRGIGETMIVVMAAGLAANLTINPFESVTTVTAQIVTLLVGDQEFDSAKTLASFALGLTLFFITLILNVIALLIVKKYREKYE